MLKPKKPLAALLSLAMLTSTLYLPAQAAEETTDVEDTYTDTSTEELEVEEEIITDNSDSQTEEESAADNSNSATEAEENTTTEDGDLETESEKNTITDNGDSQTEEESVTDASGVDEENNTATEQYVLMNIPYADFYEEELTNNDVAVDAVSSATLNKTRTSSLVGGSYHVNSDGSDITGITYPVKVSAEDYETLKTLDYVEVTDDSSVTIAVTNRGQTSETTYTGKEALFESGSYSYYTLTEIPDNYKELTVGEDGKLSFGAVVGEKTALTDATAELTTDTVYGDYELDVDGLDSLGIGTVYAVVLTAEDKEGVKTDYGLRHLENVWRTSYLAWCTGFTTSVHSSATSSDHYKSMMGKTITGITYYTDKGIYTISVENYVPIKTSAAVKVEDADIAAGRTDITVTDLPEDFDAVYTVEGLDNVSVEGSTLTFDAETAVIGEYTLVISDRNGVYAELSAVFTLTTAELPAVYNGDDSNPALIAAKDFDSDALAAYLKNITSVSVNGTSYSASGRGAVVIINTETGAVDLTVTSNNEAVFTEGENEIVVTATGYANSLTFTLTISVDKDINFADSSVITVWVPDVISNGKSMEQHSTPVVTYTYTENGKTVARKLVENYHYTVEMKSDCDYTTVGALQTYVIKAVEGSGFTGEIESSYTIYAKNSTEAKAVSKLSIALGTKSVDYTGHAITLDDVKVYDGKTLLTEGTDYDIVYKNNYNAGKASIIVIGKEIKNEATNVSYIGSKEVNFTIKKVNIKNLTPTYDTDAYSYYGKPVTISNLELKLVSGSGDNQTTYVLQEGTDYTVNYKSNNKPGTASFTLKASGNNFTGSTKKQTFTINDLKLSDIPSEALTTIEYSSKGAKLATISFGDVVLKEGTDYKVKYYNKGKNINDTVKVDIIGKNVAKNQKLENINLTVVAADFSKVTVKSESDLMIDTNKYSKKDKQIVVTDYAGAKLKLNKDYKLAWDTTNTGTQATDLTLTITPVNPSSGEVYTGTKTVTYRVASKLTAKNYTVRDKYFNGKTAVTISAADITTNNGADALSASDYKVIGYKNNTKAGTASVTLEGKGKYYGKITLKFKIKD